VVAWVHLAHIADIGVIDPANRGDKIGVNPFADIHEQPVVFEHGLDAARAGLAGTSNPVVDIAGGEADRGTENVSDIAHGSDVQVQRRQSFRQRLLGEFTIL